MTAFPGRLRAWSDTFRRGMDREHVIALIDQGAVSAANFLTGLVLGRIGTKEQFGLYTLGFTIVTMGMCVQDSLILTPYTIYSPRLRGTALSQYKASAFVHQLLYSLCILVLLVLFRAWLSLGAGPPGMVPVAEALIFVTGFVLLRNYARRVSFAALNMGEALVLDCTVSVLQVTGLLALAGFQSLTASRAYWIVGMACGIGTIPWLWARRKDLGIRFGEAMSDLKRNLSTGMWILASGLVWTMVISAYPWLLATFHGTSSAGVWAACAGVITFCNPLFLAMQNSFGPKIAHAYAEGGGEALRRFSRKVTGVFGLVLAPFCIALVCFGGGLVAAIYGDKYAGTGYIVSLLALDFLLSALTFPLSRALFTFGRAGTDFRINVVMLLCLLSFGIPFVKHYGPLGAAASLLLTDLICLVFRYVALLRSVPLETGKPVPGAESFVPSVTETK